MTLSLHNTLTNSLDPVVPKEPGHVRLYTCGPTVYARAHIGNFRTFLFEDVLRRWLDRSFDRVTHVMNLTDVDDKIIRNARANGKAITEETEPYIAAFFEDVDALGIRRAHHYPKATDYIDEMVSLIGKLEARGHAYRREGSVYYPIASFPAYGKLSGIRRDELLAGASGRVEADEYSKDDVRDFALWKAVEPEDPYGWDTPLGRGRPGWHIECSAMSMSLLGEHLDIHCGGIDNIFPHHENEIAQSEGATGVPFVSIWCHSKHLQIDGEKMAKSQGNFFSAHDLLASGETDASTIRYLLTAVTHYRKQLSYSEESLATAKEAVERWKAFDRRIAALKPAESAPSIRESIDGYWAKFSHAMDEDLNLPEAMGYAFQTVREVNKQADDSGGLLLEDIETVRTFIANVDDVLNVLSLDGHRALEEELSLMLARREQARADRDWSQSDTLRSELLDRGIVVEDTPEGQSWHRR